MSTPVLDPPAAVPAPAPSSRPNLRPILWGLPPMLVVLPDAQESGSVG